VLGQIRRQAVQRPGGEGEAQGLRVSQGGLHHEANLFARVGRGPPAARLVGQPGQPLCLEAMPPQLDRAQTQVEALGNRADPLP